MAQRVRWALFGLMVLLLVAAIPDARAAPPSYTLTGYADQPKGPVLPGVTVDVISGATHQAYPVATSSGGFFQLTSATSGNQLTPGWWGAWVPPQTGLHLIGCNPCTVLPAQQGPTYYWESALNLTTAPAPIVIPNVLLLHQGATISGQVRDAFGSPVSGATVQLLAPKWDGFVLNNTTSNATGNYSLASPITSLTGLHWVLRTTVSGPTSEFNYTQVAANVAKVAVNPVVDGYLVFGHILKTGGTLRVPNGGNVTLLDTGNWNVFQTASVPGFYSIGTYPANFVGPGAESFDVVVSPYGYQTMWYPLTVSSASLGLANEYNVTTPKIAAPAAYNTTLTFGTGFGKVNITTRAVLANDSIFPDLPNASVGQLWAQLGLDYGGTATFNAGTNWATVRSWILAQGPFFPAGESVLNANGSVFGQPTNFTFSSSTPTGSLGLSSGASLFLNWTQNYNVTTTKVPIPGKSGYLSFDFRHPAGSQAFNYTFVLPSGYVLQAGTPNPTRSVILPGPNQTFTTFTVESLPVAPGAPAYTLANFTLVKSGGITANVNVSETNFTFSKLNLLNQTHNNYTAVVGAGQNVTFSGLNSTFPAGTNGTVFKWKFGDGNLSTLHTGTTGHIYASAGLYVGDLNVTSSGGLQNNVTFKIYAGSARPTPKITSNATASETKNANGAPYLLVNASRVLHFNITGSTSPLGITGVTQLGVLSDAVWNASGNKFVAATANYSASTAAKVNSNFTVSFLGAGNYLTTTTINGVPVSFFGWRYNLTLTLWDGQGHRNNTSLVVLVRDTQKPLPVITITDVNGKNVTSSGLVEGANHTAFVYFSSAYSTDPHNGSLTLYNWTITNKGNGSFDLKKSQPALPGFKNPGKWSAWLAPQTKPYTVNLTVTDRAGNTQYTTAQLTISINTSLRPVLSTTNLTAPTMMTDGTSNLIWVNITNTIGKNSTAQNVSVLFYTLPPSGQGTPSGIAASPASVEFFNYTNQTSGTLSSAPTATGVLPKLAYNHTVRAVIHWSPVKQGDFSLYANATATNEFPGDYGPNVAHVSVTLKPSPLVLYEEVGGVVAAVVLVIVGLVVFYRRRVSRPAKTTGKSGLERGSRKDEEDEDEEE